MYVHLSLLCRFVKKIKKALVKGIAAGLLKNLCRKNVKTFLAKPFLEKYIFVTKTL